MPLTKVRTNLGKVVKQVHLKHEYVILEKGGIPVAALMAIDEFEDYLEANEPAVKQAIAEGTADYQAGRTRPVERLPSGALLENPPEPTHALLAAARRRAARK
jgi:PHD/YefM family antitoxin component YafN of YafNO toxin-antitoxin module